MARKPGVLYKVRVYHNDIFHCERKTEAVSISQAVNNVRFNMFGRKDWTGWAFEAKALKSASRQLNLPGIETPNAQLL